MKTFSFFLRLIKQDFRLRNIFPLFAVARKQAGKYAAIPNQSGSSLLCNVVIVLFLASSGPSCILHARSKEEEQNIYCPVLSFGEKSEQQQTHEKILHSNRFTRFAADKIFSSLSPTLSYTFSPEIIRPNTRFAGTVCTPNVTDTHHSVSSEKVNSFNCDVKYNQFNYKILIYGN